MNYYIKLLELLNFVKKGIKRKNSEFTLLIMSSIPYERIAAKRYGTVKMLLTYTHLIWTPHYYRQLAVSLCKARTFFLI